MTKATDTPQLEESKCHHYSPDLKTDLAGQSAGFEPTQEVRIHLDYDLFTSESSSGAGELTLSESQESTFSEKSIPPGTRAPPPSPTSVWAPVDWYVLFSRTSPVIYTGEIVNSTWFSRIY
jgi:hypothetical protein